MSRIKHLMVFIQHTHTHTHTYVSTCSHGHLLALCHNISQYPVCIDNGENCCTDVHISSNSLCSNIASQCVHSVFRCKFSVARCSSILWRSLQLRPLSDAISYTHSTGVCLFGATVIALVSFVPEQLQGSNGVCVEEMDIHMYVF